jgi:4-hydroxy-tetrahydrodipicolinate synthase
MFQGSMVALVTPMQPDGSLDWKTLADLIDWHVQEGTDAIVAVGTTGESPTLDMHEHVEVIRRVVDIVNKRVPVIAGTGANSTSEALELTQSALEAKADACLLVTPYYNKPTQQGLFLHHEYLAKSVPIPQILYNVPGRTGVDMLPDTVAKLSKVPNIIGIKEATGDLQRMRDIQNRVDSTFILLSGDDFSAVEFIALGGLGEISVTANVAPREVAEMCRLASQGQLAAARAINDRLMSLHKALFIESNPIPVKWALTAMGKIAAGIRLPLTPLSDIHHATVTQALQNAGLLTK